LFRSLPILVFLVIVITFEVHAQSSNERSVTKVTDGVYFIKHRSSPFDGGNTTVVVGSKCVFLVDSAFLPSATKYDIEQIKKVTDKPVCYLLNTHWHGDHNTGNDQYVAAYPQVQIIAQRETKKDMDLIVGSFMQRRAANIAKAEKRVQTGKNEKGEPLTADELEQERGNVEAYKAQAGEFTGAWRYQPPTVVFEQAMDVDLGDRKVQIRHFGRGNTSGDAIAYLPVEKILVTGDLVVYPIPFLFDGYPSEWAETLTKLAGLEAETIIPGHGILMRDKQYLLLVRDLLSDAVKQLNARLHVVGPAEFVNYDDVKDGIDLSAFRERFSNGDKDRAESFDRAAARLSRLVFDEARLR
jgi:cyclase